MTKMQDKLSVVAVIVTVAALIGVAVTVMGSGRIVAAASAVALAVGLLGSAGLFARPHAMLLRFVAGISLALATVNITQGPSSAALLYLLIIVWLASAAVVALGRTDVRTVGGG